jgi:hypothetical protein
MKKKERKMLEDLRKDRMTKHFNGDISGHLLLMTLLQNELEIMIMLQNSSLKIGSGPFKLSAASNQQDHVTEVRD